MQYLVIYGVRFFCGSCTLVFRIELSHRVRTCAPRVGKRTFGASKESDHMTRHLAFCMQTSVHSPKHLPPWLLGFGGFAPTRPLSALCPDRFWIFPHSLRHMIH